jgi:hypothetical protein
MYPQLQDIDFRVDATSLDVPVYFVQGSHEAGGRAEVATEWFTMLEAPEQFRAVMTDTVPAQTANKERS